MPASRSANLLVIQPSAPAQARQRSMRRPASLSLWRAGYDMLARPAQWLLSRGARSPPSRRIRRRQGRPESRNFEKSPPSLAFRRLSVTCLPDRFVTKLLGVENSLAARAECVDRLRKNIAPRQPSILRVQLSAPNDAVDQVEFSLCLFVQPLAPGQDQDRGNEHTKCHAIAGVKFGGHAKPGFVRRTRAGDFQEAMNHDTARKSGENMQWIVSTCQTERRTQHFCKRIESHGSTPGCNFSCRKRRSFMYSTRIASGPPW